jgi:hypothetical protein
MSVLYAIAALVAAATLYCASVGIRTLRDDFKQKPPNNRHATGGQPRPHPTKQIIFKIKQLFACLKGSKKPDTEDDSHRYERTVAESTKSISRLTLALVFVGIIGALVAYRTLRAIEGQLDEMRDEQIPIIWAGKNLGAPERFRNEKTGMIQVYWSFHFTNDGKGFVTGGTYETFIKLGNGQFVRSYGQSDANKLTPIAPTDDQFFTIISAPMTQEAIDSISKTERGISIKATFIYFGTSAKSHETSVCLTKLLSGAIQFCDGGYVK